jgi:hypothetical protein
MEDFSRPLFQDSESPQASHADKLHHFPDLPKLSPLLFPSTYPKETRSSSKVVSPGGNGDFRQEV